jgi:uncharacterized membrane protein
VVSSPSSCSSFQAAPAQLSTRRCRHAQYHADVKNAKLTEQVDGTERVANSAGFGALIGALFGLVTGDPEAVAYGAGWGAVSGAASGGMSADQKIHGHENCLYNRGYAVLN